MCQVVRRSVWGHGVRAGCTLFHRRSTSRRCTRRGPTPARVGPAGLQRTAGPVGPASAGRHATLNRAWNSIVVFFIGGITPVAEPPCSGTLGPGCASYVGSRATVLNGFCIAQWRLQPLDPGAAARPAVVPAPLARWGQSTERLRKPFVRRERTSTMPSIHGRTEPPRSYLVLIVI